MNWSVKNLLISLKKEFRRRISKNRELKKYIAFLNEIRKVKEPEEFAPKLKKLYLRSFPFSDVLLSPLSTVLSNNYNNVYNGIMKIRRHIWELFAWMNVYEKIINEEEKLALLAIEIEDALTLTTNSIYFLREKVIYAVVITASVYQKIIGIQTKLDIEEKTRIDYGKFTKHFCHIDCIKKLKEKIDELDEFFQEKPLYFRWKHAHRITPGVEKYHGQYYTIEISKKHLRMGISKGDMIKLEEIKPNIEMAYSKCLDIFCEFENYCIDYLKVEEENR